MKTKVLIIIITCFSILLTRCSVEKNTATSRAYHNTTLKYNIYFNAREAYKRGINRIYSSNTDNFNEILPIFVDSKEANSSTASGEMEKAIQKSAKGIKLHSIKKKPKESGNSKRAIQFRNQNEFNKWIDDCYLLMGKSYFLKRDFIQARHNFEYITRQFPNLDARHHANLYLVRTYNESQNYHAAKETLDFIEGEKDLPAKLDPYFATVYADYYIKQKQYEDAIPKLTRAIKGTKNKRDKIRYTYILGQIYFQQNNMDKAYEMFEIVAKKNTSYEMEFNAKINMARCYENKGKSKKDIRKLLQKMLRDDKNKEYLDQIYYALAEIDYKTQQLDNALKNYKFSSATSISNDYQKAISSMKAGEIYFSKLDYKNAQIYFDTCMSFLPASYENYVEVRTKAQNLTELIQQINIIEHEDSLQTIAKMPENERNKIIDKIINDIIQKEQEAREQEQQQQVSSMLFDQKRQGTYNNPSAPAGGKWYFYNPAQLSFGKNEFTKTWGTRKNEDNWRRKNKSIIDVSNEEIASSSGDATNSQGDAKQQTNSKGRITNNKDKAYYLQDLPLKENDIKNSNKRIIDASFALGKIYKERFSNITKSIESYEALNRRFPDNEYLLLSYYNLYLLYKLQNDNSEANKYKQLIISKFSDSNYAKLLNNPNYLADIEQKKRTDEQLYISLYDNYMAGKYNVVLNTASQFLNDNPENNTLAPNFAFLKALAIGKTSDTTTFKTKLVEFMQQYSQHDLASVAQNILHYFGTTNIEALIADLKSRPEVVKEIEQTDDINIAKDNKETSIFNYDEQAEHYYIMLVNNTNVDLKRLGFEIRNFNIFNFSMKTFIVSNILFDNNHELIIVKSFKNKRQSLNYSKMIINSEDVFSKLKNKEYSLFVISVDNFTKLQSTKNIKAYTDFYNQHYK